MYFRLKKMCGWQFSSGDLSCSVFLLTSLEETDWGAIYYLYKSCWDLDYYSHGRFSVVFGRSVQAIKWMTG